MEQLIFYLFAAVAISAALVVVLQQRAVYSVLALIVCLGSIAVLFFQLGAYFIGAVQVIVYAGAIMVLFLFVVMLLDPESEIFSEDRLKSIPFFGILAAALMAFVLLQALPFFAAVSLPETAEPTTQNVRLIARLLFQDYLLPFEVTSILILIAVMGAVVLAKRPR